MEKVIVSWSGGKDSAFALHELQKSKRYDPVSLLTTVTEGYDRVSMHGVRNSLLELQARSIGLPLETISISKNSSNEEYESKMMDTLTRFAALGISSVAFGDIFLEDLKKYREEKLARLNMSGVFPIWKRDTSKLAREFINMGFKAILTCVDSKYLNEKFAGRCFDEDLLLELPKSVDPCGENGEFHSFVFDGPVFKRRITFNKGNVVLRDSRFYYCDLLPSGDDEI